MARNVIGSISDDTEISLRITQKQTLLIMDSNIRSIIIKISNLIFTCRMTRY